MINRFLILVIALALSRASPSNAAEPPLQISGIYPHLAAFNEYGECGIGAVVPWAGKLWFITYPPHFRTGSTDKLYELDPNLNLTLRPESVGGTHANRLIHRESNQLIIGPYFIDDKGVVRAADVKKSLVGRQTATARHLADPANKVYFYDMEGPLYEVNVHTLAAKRLFAKPVPGWHGKGAYTGQGVLVVANNGEVAAGKEDKTWELPLSKWSKGPEEAGVLAEFNGTDWRIISRRQHTEVTGPGGIYGAQVDADPIWSTGWDKRSVLLDVRDAKDKAWHTFRLPKASHTYDPKHGWYTEWPRIREIAPTRLMMTMHGMMFDFPSSFRPGQTAGIRPINSYLRYIPDFCNWNGRVVLASDETSIMQNPMAGVSQSNLWFGAPEQLATDFGPAAGWGGVWLGDSIKANQPSDPYLLAGFEQRVLHLAHKSDETVSFTLEIDEKGDGKWKPYTTLKVPANGYVFHVIPPDVKGEWIRLTADKDTIGSAYFHYLTPSKYDGSERNKLFASLATPVAPFTGGIIRPGKDKQLQFLSRSVDATGKPGPETYYEVDEKLNFKQLDNAAALAEVHKLADSSDTVFTIDEASVIITTKDGRLRLPKASAAFDKPGPIPARALREVESERQIANLAGTFYEVPRSAENAAGKAEWKNLKPIASHDNLITDFCSWRGLLVLAGTRSDAQPDGHYFKPADSTAGLWFGAVDDLWRLGKPVGHGGPWNKTSIKASEPSDPYLMTNYDKKTLILSHDSPNPVTFTIEVDPANVGYWKTYKKITAPPGEPTTHLFPTGFGAYWVRVTADNPCKATATFVYE
jgi:hypothetical protein